jgi:hypothetical protein
MFSNSLSMIQKDGNTSELRQGPCKNIILPVVPLLVYCVNNNNNNNNNNALYTLHRLISANMDLKLGPYVGVKYGMAPTKQKQFRS